MKKKYKNAGIVVILCILLISIIIKKEMVQKEFINYTILFLNTYVPSSFLFLIISSLLLDFQFIEIIQKITKKDSVYLYLLLITAISGFPSASIQIKTILEKKTIDEETARKMLWYTHFPNPLFVINNVSKILNSTILAYKLLLSIIISNVLLFLIIPKKEIKKEKDSSESSLSKSIQKGIEHTFQSITIVYGISICFSIISLLISQPLKNNIYCYIIINGLLDLTKGIHLLTLLSNTIIKSYLVILFIMFGSLSIHMQTKSILSDTKISYYDFLFGRIISCMLTMVIFTIMMLLS